METTISKHFADDNATLSDDMLCRYEVTSWDVDICKPNALPHNICIASVGIEWDVDIQFDGYSNTTKNAISSAPQQFASSNAAAVYHCNFIKVRQIQCNVSQNELFGNCTKTKTFTILIINSHNNSNAKFGHMSIIQIIELYIGCCPITVMIM